MDTSVRSTVTLGKAGTGSGKGKQTTVCLLQASIVLCEEGTVPILQMRRLRLRDSL